MNDDPSYRDDAALIRAAQGGDRPAFEQLVKRYYGQAFSTALTWVHNREMALDISQEAFVRVHRGLGRCDPERSFGAWLYAITRNLCRNYLTRQRGRMKVFSDLAGGDAELPAPAGDEGTMEQRERRELVWRGLQALPPEAREIIILKDIEDFTYRDISEALGIPMGSVMSRLYYARRKLADLLKSRMEP